MQDQLERVLPTPETKAKLRPGTIERLLTAKEPKINSDHVRAADEIEWVMKGVFGFLYAKSNMRDHVDCIGPAGTAERLATSLAEAHQDRFKPWANWFKENRCDPVVSVCLDIVTDGVTARELDAKYRKRKGWAANLLIEGLEKYAELAGWIKCKP